MGFWGIFAKSVGKSVLESSRDLKDKSDKYANSRYTDEELNEKFKSSSGLDKVAYGSALKKRGYEVDKDGIVD